MRACARQMTQMAVANRLLYLRDSEGDWGQGAGMPRSLRKKDARFSADRRAAFQQGNAGNWTTTE